MSIIGLLNGTPALELSTGARLAIDTFLERRDNLPSGPRLRSVGKETWTAELEGEGLPTSAHATHNAVDFLVVELAAGLVVLVVGDRYAYSLRASDGKVLGGIATQFIGRESLDFFFASPSPDATRFVIASTRRIGVFASSGEVLADVAVGGLVAACAWVSGSAVSYDFQELEGLQHGPRSSVLST